MLAFFSGTIKIYGRCAAFGDEPNDVKTGVPLAILNEPALTALRTGAVGGVSIRHPAVAKSLGQKINT